MNYLDENTIAKIEEGEAIEVMRLYQEIAEAEMV